MKPKSQSLPSVYSEWKEQREFMSCVSAKFSCAPVTSGSAMGWAWEALPRVGREERSLLSHGERSAQHHMDPMLTVQGY